MNDTEYYCPADGCQHRDENPGDMLIHVQERHEVTTPIEVSVESEFGEPRRRVGRLIADEDLSPTDVCKLTKAINLGTRFRAERSAPMRVDVFEYDTDD